jgi:signal transduction histidine kinase
MSGVEFLRAVRHRRPDATRLLFTGYSDLNTVIEAINEGHIFRYIAKPWDAEELAAVVRQAFDQHNLRAERRRLIAELQASNSRLAEANLLKSQFMEVASHELNTPVAVMTGIVDVWGLSLPGGGTERERYWLERLRNSGRRLATTLQRILRLLETDSLHETLHLERVELDPLIRGVLEELGPFREARRQSFRLESDPDLGVVEADASKITDVMVNLLVNAIKFTPDGGTIVVRTEGLDDRVRVEVEDSGQGIPQDEQPFVFEAFFTGRDTRHHSSGAFEYGKRGIGIGLHIVKRFIDMHGGAVSARSEPSQGAVFRFELPRRPRRLGTVDTPGPGPRDRVQPPDDSSWPSR